MRTRTKTLTRLVLAVSAISGIASTMSAQPALADPHNDGFLTVTTDRDTCGEEEFVDYGPGAPGGGDNDDYIVIHDYCADGHGVKAWAWLDGQYLGGKYDRNGYAGAPVVWDPFPDGNVKRGQKIGLKVCLVDGNNDKTPTACRSLEHKSHDG